MSLSPTQQQQRHANEFDDEYLLGLKNTNPQAFASMCWGGVEPDRIRRIIPPMPEIGGGNSDPHSNYTSSSSDVESWWSLPQLYKIALLMVLSLKYQQNN